MTIEAVAKLLLGWT